MRNLRLHFDARVGWILDVPVTIGDHQIKRIAQWALPFQVQRLSELPIGEKKSQLARAIGLLKKGQITQRLFDHDRDGIIVPFASTEKVTTKEYYYG